MKQSVPDNVWDAVAQMSHVLGGMCLVSYTTLILGADRLWITVPIFVGLTAVKEFWYDQNFETPDERGSNLKDFLFYCLGQAIGLTVVLLKTYLG